jgi:tetratricopeptide (TPR) repeat protein
MRISSILLGLGLLASQTSLAEDLEKAKKEMQEGGKALDAKDCKKALGHFKAASEYAPSKGGPHREMGKSYECLERYEEAKREYETYLSIQPDASDAPTIQSYLDDVTKKIKDTTPDEPTPTNTGEPPGTLSFSSSLEKGAKIYIDEKLVGKSPLSPQSLPPGTHKIRIEKKGFITLEQEVSVEANGALDFNENLTPSEEGTKEVKKGPVIASFSTGAVGIGVGAFAGFKALQLSQDLEDRADEPIPLDEFEEILKDGRNLNIATVAGYSVGALGVAAGIYFLVKGTPSSETSAKLHLTQNGASLSVRF